MFNTFSFVFLLLWTSVLGKNCFTHNFESDIDELLHSNTAICINGQPWQLGNFSSIDITEIPSGSNRFIEPKSALTCESTPLFDMSEGTLEVNFYMKSNVLGDFLSVFVSDVTDVEEQVHGRASFSKKTPGYQDGWNVLKIDITSSFKGYISFMGEQSEGSIVLIDSFRYYAQSYEDKCKIYEIDDASNVTTEGTTESTTEPTINPDSEHETTTSLTESDAITVPEIETTTIPGNGTTVDSESILTTISPEDTEKCVTYNFDKDFDSLFTHNHDLCSNFNKWELRNYATNGVDSVNAKGTSYLSPNEDLSCISAFPIRMSPNGLVEVNVYINPVTKFDYIIVLVKNIVEGSVDTVAGTYIYDPSASSFEKGWNVLRINVVNLRSFDGYLIFLGAATDGSTVLVDSFRYVPPWASPDDEECQFR